MSLVGVKLRRRAQLRKVTRGFLYHGTVFVLAFVMLYPLLWLFTSSFKPPDEIWTDVLALWAKNPTLQNYILGWRGLGFITFTTFYRNTVFYAGAATIIQVFASAWVGYGFSRLRFVGRRFWFACMMVSLMLPSQVTLIPAYIMFARLGWINTFYPLLVPRLGGSSFFIFMFMQFIRGLPIELDEAAEIDGCGKVGIFFKITLPLIRPALFTAAIFTFYWTWSDFMGPLVYLNKPQLYTISVALRMYTDPGSVSNWGGVFAMSALSLVPVLVVFVLFQKHIVEGIGTTGLHG
jgi:multiple sugar transport system permease protein